MAETTGITACFQINWPGFSLDVDLNLPARGVTVLFGPSGSGKTTLLRCIAGLEHAPQGRLTVEGEVWQDKNRSMPTHKRPIGYVFQEASLFSHLAVMDNLRYGMRRNSAGQRVSLDQAIVLLGIGHLLNRKPERLSGGERQRVAIARALAVSPRLLLMDEPLAALELKRKQEILPYLERLHDELDIPVLYVSHSPDEVARLADHLVVMENGRVVTEGPLAEILARVDLPIQIGEEAGVVLSATVGALDSEWHLARIDFAGGSLWMRDCGVPPGTRVRVRILARDVSLARQEMAGCSIQNHLHGYVDALGDDEHPGLMLARIRVGDSFILARLARRAGAAIGIAPGQNIVAQIKLVALMR